MSSRPTDKTHILVIGALGVVFGDIGTSPLYAVKVCFTGQYAIPPTPPNVLGLLSLIFWSLILVVSIKYSLFILRADDEGQGGIFAMLAALHKKMGPQLGRKLVLAALFGSALLYGDGLITPVISVLSALEGLEVATTQAKPVVLPLACVILFALFWAQSHGTGRIGKYFGPVMVLWFSVIGLIGVQAIVHKPQILAAVDPRQAVQFFLENGGRGFFLLGAVVLCITGCEALFADLGHFGLKPIRISWYFFALPALLCNYFGQGALLLANPAAAADPFYSLVPRTFLYPMVALATVATIIASQAIISGVFSLTRQAVQLGFLPRLRIVHTSEMAEGQVYTPDVNAAMMLAAILLALYFKQSENLADAYGIAVTGDMFITSVVFYFITRRIWGWSRWRAAPLYLVFACLDLTFFSSCLGKIASGGWFPVVIALGLMVVMVTWWDGWKMLGLKVMGLTLPLEKFMARISAAEPIRLPGTGVFLSTFHKEIPPMLLQYLIHTSALHEKLVLLSVVTADVPVVAESDRLEIHNMGREVYRVMARSGFMETPDAPQFLAQARIQGLNIDPENTKYYVGRISLVPAPSRTMARWRRFLFTFMLRNAVSGSTYLNIPPAKVMEIGVQMEF